MLFFSQVEIFVTYILLPKFHYMLDQLVELVAQPDFTEQNV